MKSNTELVIGEPDEIDLDRLKNLAKKDKNKFLDSCVKFLKSNMEFKNDK